MHIQMSSFLLASLALLFCISSLEKSFAFQATKESNNLRQYHFVHLNSLFPSSSCSSSAKGPKRKASLEVVHKHGPCSQLNHSGKAEATISHNDIMNLDNERVKYIQSRLSKNLGGENRVKELDSTTLPAKSGRLIGSGDYYVVVGLGTPKRDLSLTFDTGSYLTWTQCEPCAGSCYKQQDPIFDPSKSSSYTNIKCTSSLCTQFRSAGCSSSTDASCIYDVKYGDNSISRGFLSQERLTITATDIVHDFLFGCGQDNEGLFRGTAGLMGLSRHPISFVQQTSSIYNKIFSYCLPSTPSSLGHLTFGASAATNANLKYTPFSTISGENSFYGLDIVGISVGGTKLPAVSSSTFSAGGSIIDSGTHFCFASPPWRRALPFKQQRKATIFVNIILFTSTLYFHHLLAALLPKWYIHKHGPCSQLKHRGKAEATISHNDIMNLDNERVKYIQSRLSKNLGRENTVKDLDSTTLPAESGSLIGSANYVVVVVGLGTPKRDLSLVFDTGSDLTWTQCEPCAGSCYKQQDPIFDPSKSSSYTNITCTSSLCSQLTSDGIKSECSSSTDASCIYDAKYGDNSTSVGFLSQERLTITATDIVDDFLFGCGQDNEGLFNGSAGLMGLGRHPISIVQQTSSNYNKIFSYCLPATSSSLGHLTFGASAATNASLIYTPLSTISGDNSFYRLDIVSISVGGTKLPAVSSSTFSAGGSIIDSGTVITRLAPTVYAALRSAFRQGMEKYPVANEAGLLDTCYDFSGYKEISVPRIDFEFSGGVTVESAQQVCLAFAANGSDNDITVFGNVQQKTLEVVYDVKGGRIGFGAAGCK
ncbi:Aspartyl protease family protein [Glycine max]|nr:Aspartyl protease family protein [Glycine max]